MYSSDCTRAIATQFGAKVLLHPPMGHVEPARALGVAEASQDWILILDADEIVPPSLVHRLRTIIEQDEADVVEIPWRNFLLGEQINFGGWGLHQDSHKRFFKRGYFVLDERVHRLGKAIPEARVLVLPPEEPYAIVHISCFDIEHFVEKANRYSTAKALQMYRQGQRSNPFKALMRGFLRFFHNYIHRRGFRDGWRGFYLATLSAFERFLFEAKLDEIGRTGGRIAVERLYEQLAESLLNDGAETLLGDPRDVGKRSRDF